MQKNLVQKEANDTLAEDLLDKTSQLKVEGGMVSDPNEVKKYNDWIQTNTANIREKFAAGDMDAKEASKNLAKIIQVYNTNEDIKFFNTDQKLSAATRQRIAEGKANNAISSNISYLNGNLEAEALSSKSGLDALAKAHNLTNPTGFYDKENYQHQLDHFVANTVASEWDAEPKEYKKINGVNMLVTKSGGKTKEDITRQKVLEWGLNASEQEFRNTSTPYMQYQKDLARKLGYEYTPEQFATDAMNAYSGYYTKDITKSNDTYTQLSGGTETSKQGDPVAVPLEGTHEKIGFNRDNTKAINKTKYAKWLLNPLGGVNEGKEAMTPEDLDISELQETEKRIVTNYIQQYGKEKRWGHLLNKDGSIKDIMHKPTQKKLYDEIANISDTFSKFISTNQTGEPISYISPTADNSNLTMQQQNNNSIWVSTFGNHNEVTVDDIFNNPAIPTVIRLSDMKQVKKSDIASEELPTKIPQVVKYTPENLLPIMTGDKSFKGGLEFKIGDERYIIRDNTVNDTDIYINNVYNELIVNRNQFVDIPITNSEGEVVKVKMKINNDNKVFIANSNKQLLSKKPFENVSSAFSTLKKLQK